MCCETCPAAFHIECAHLDSMPEDAWYCSDCAHGKRPLYGDIIWIKIGNYRSVKCSKIIDIVEFRVIQIMEDQ